jgi:hypothetical protein
MMKRALLVVGVCALVTVVRIAWPGSTTVFAQDGMNWPQWGQNPQHTGTINVVGQDLGEKLADIIYDPLVPEEQAANNGELLVHYQVPIVDGQDVFMAFKSGDYSHPFNSQVWHEKRLHWQAGQLEEQWDFTTDWKPEPRQLAGWEPVFHGVLANDDIYVPGAGGTIFRLARGSGTMITRINPFATIDANTFVAGPLTADSTGNIFYNTLKLNSSLSAVGSWLVKVGADNSTSKVSFTTLVSDAPTGPNECEVPFSGGSVPWPPTAGATPTLSSAPCGLQRAGLNVAPAIAPDGTIYTISRAHNFSRYGYLVAVHPDLTPKWHASLRVNLLDGCGVTIPIQTAPGVPEKGKCNRFTAVGNPDPGYTIGVDPQVNHGGEGRVIDQSSSSPTVLPDGSVLYGAYTRYNVARGHLLKFSSTGQFVTFYDFGWDSTPAVFGDASNSHIVIKDNHYDEESGFYCNPGAGGFSDLVCASTGIPAGPFYITQLNKDLSPEWKAHSTETNSCTPSGCVSDHPHGFEWCINAPVIDANNTVFVESEDGNVYKIPQGQTGIFDLPPGGSGTATRLFLRLAIGAAYTPFSIDPQGRLYAQNAGHLFVIGN